MGLGKIVKNVVRGALPLFQSVDMKYQVDNLLYENPDLKDALDTDPRLRAYLEDELKVTFDDNYWRHLGARFVDTYDQVSSGVEGIALVAGTPVLEEGVKIFTETPDILFKTLYAGAYLADGGYEENVGYLGAMELGSLLPGGELIDFANLYVNNEESYIREKAADSFRDRLTSRLEDKAQNNEPANNNRFERRRVA